MSDLILVPGCREREKSYNRVQVWLLKLLELAISKKSMHVLFMMCGWISYTNDTDIKNTSEAQFCLDLFNHFLKTGIAVEHILSLAWNFNPDRNHEIMSVQTHLEKESRTTEANVRNSLGYLTGKNNVYIATSPSLLCWHNIIFPPGKVSLRDKIVTNHILVSLQNIAYLHGCSVEKALDMWIHDPDIHGSYKTFLTNCVKYLIHIENFTPLCNTFIKDRNIHNSNFPSIHHIDISTTFPWIPRNV